MMGTILSRRQGTTPTTTATPCQQETTTTEDNNGAHGHGPALRIPEWLPTATTAEHILPQSTLLSWSKADTKDHATVYHALIHLRKTSIRVIDKRLEWIVDTLVPSVMSLLSTKEKNDTTSCSVPLPAQFAQIIQAEIHGVDSNNGALEISLTGDHRIHVPPTTIEDNDDTVQRYAIQVELCADDQKHVTFMDIDVMGDHKCHVYARSQLLMVDGKSLWYSPLYGMPDAEKENAAANRPECIICLTEFKSAALVPCQHLCLCTSCALILKMQHDPNNRRCPVCRTLIQSILLLECQDDEQQQQQSSHVETREGP